MAQLDDFQRRISGEQDSQESRLQNQVASGDLAYGAKSSLGDLSAGQGVQGEFSAKAQPQRVADDADEDALAIPASEYVVYRPGAALT